MRVGVQLCMDLSTCFFIFEFLEWETLPWCPHRRLLVTAKRVKCKKITNKERNTLKKS